MSYRNDHDAALSRVDALERELAQLRGERKAEEKRKRIAPEKGHRVLGVVAVGAGVIACAVGVLWSMTAREYPARIVEEPEMQAPEAEVAPEPIVMSREACERSIEEWAVRDARATDPRVAGHESAEVILRRAVVCAGVLPSVEQENVTSLITVYYESDPVALDGYATAEQLWREYHRARAGRGIADGTVPKS